MHTEGYGRELAVVASTVRVGQTLRAERARIEAEVGEHIWLAFLDRMLIEVAKATFTAMGALEEEEG
jgi:hypothetical protein